MATTCKLAIFVLIFLVFAAPASAQVAPGDPEGSSPAGAVYQIPVDRAREDAAPKRRAPAGDEGSRSNGGRPVTPAPVPGSSGIRTENGFGTSSQVPGAPAPPAESEDGEDGDDGEDGGSGDGEAGAGSGSGTGGTGEGGAPSAPATDLGTRLAAAGPEPSGLRAGLLVILAAIVGLGLGMAARLAQRYR